MRRALVAVAVLLSGCGTSPFNLFGAKADAEIKTAEQQMLDASNKASESLALYAKLPHKNCDGPELDEATEAANRAVSLSQKHELGVRMVAGGQLLSVADAAKSKGCAQQARAIYDDVLRAFTGAAYGDLRDRAMVGIQGLHGKA
jgi:hypothetical protein